MSIESTEKRLWGICLTASSTTTLQQRVIWNGFIKMFKSLDDASLFLKNVRLSLKLRHYDNLYTTIPTKCYLFNSGGLTFDIDSNTYHTGDNRPLSIVFSWDGVGRQQPQDIKVLESILEDLAFSSTSLKAVAASLSFKFRDDLLMVSY